VTSKTHESHPTAPAVLVVDDDRSTRVLLRRVLESAGFTVDVAADGVLGAQLALTGKYDAILLDLVMPQPDGFAILRELASSRPQLLRKIIVITGYPQQVVSTDTFALLTKPLDVSEVVRLTRQCTEEGTLS
jgi:DNA-binding response OmpR family regulator